MPIQRNKIRAFHSGIGDFGDLKVSLNNDISADIDFIVDLYARGLYETQYEVYHTEHIGYQITGSGTLELDDPEQWINLIVSRYKF